jgi:nucleoside-diphosphate-sugar epimerase
VYGLGAERFERFIERAVRHPLLSLSRRGNRILHCVHIRDVAEAVLLAGTQPEAAANAFNVAGNEAVPTRKLIIIARQVAVRGFGESISFRSAANSRLVYDISKARALLRFTPKVTLQEGIAEIITALNQPRMTSRRPAPVCGRLY